MKYLLLATTFLFTTTTAFAADSKTLASFEGKAIVTQEDLDLIYEANPSLKQQPTKNLVEQLAGQKILALQAKKEKLEKDPKNKKILDDTYDAVILQLYSKKVQDSLTDAEIKKVYDDVFLSISEDQNETSVAIIVTDTSAKAKRISDRLKSNASEFEKIAKAESIDPRTGSQGGNLGFVLKGTLPPAADAFIFDSKTKKGSISAPITIDNGQGGQVFMIIKANESRKYKRPSLDQVKPQIQSQLVQQKLSTKLEELKKSGDFVVNAS